MHNLELDSDLIPKSKMIELINVKPGDVFSHSIVYLFGFCSQATPTNQIQVINHKNDSAIVWSIVNGYFKVIFLHESFIITE